MSDAFNSIMPALGADNNSVDVAIGVTFIVTFVITFLIALLAECLMGLRKKPAPKDPIGKDVTGVRDNAKVGGTVQRETDPNCASSQSILDITECEGPLESPVTHAFPVTETDLAEKV